MFIPDDQRLQNLKLPQVGDTLTPQAARELAYTVALQGLGQVSPNPPVGAVIVDEEHRYMGHGAHLKFGKEHAEVNALKMVETNALTAKLKNASIYVTLEPCSFYGKTPPCTDALKRLGLQKVFYGCLDPNPKVSGKGVSILGNAGTTCEAFPFEDQKQCQQLIEIFAWNQMQGTPYVGLKAAITLDGSIGHTGGKNESLTGERARAYAHFLRNRYDGIAVGAKTLVLDNPRLNYRHPILPGRSPKKVVFDTQLNGLKALDIAKIHLLKENPEDVFWLVQKFLVKNPLCATLARLGATVIPLDYDAKAQTLDLGQVMKALWENRVYSLLLEGGSGLYRHFIDAGLVNKYHMFIAPKIFLAPDKQNWLEWSRHHKIRLEGVQMFPMKDDVLIEGYPAST